MLLLCYLTAFVQVLVAGKQKQAVLWKYTGAKLIHSPAEAYVSRLCAFLWGMKEGWSHERTIVKCVVIVDTSLGQIEMLLFIDCFQFSAFTK